jgi:hypothetical protein
LNLAVICSHFNSAGFHVPRRNLLRFLRQLEIRKIPVFVAELAYEDQDFFLPESPSVFRFRTDKSNVLWHKENLLNLAAGLVPPKYDCLAWIDTDLLFMSEDWAERAQKQLERYSVVQLFSEAWWTDEDGRCFRSSKSTMADGTLKMGSNHPGFAWAARRELWSEAGGLCDLAILGGGDALFAAACLGGDIPKWLHYPDWKNWTKRLTEWAHTSGKPSVVSGVVVHEWHGTERDRAYIPRNLLLKDFDISRMVVRRQDGLLQFSDEVPSQLREAFLHYFAWRREDGRAMQSPMNAQSETTDS